MTAWEWETGQPVTVGEPEDGQLLRRLAGPDEAAAARLHSRLVAAAQQEGLLDVAYRVIDSPVGKLLLAATGDGLVRVAFDCEGPDRVLARLAAVVSPRILHAPGRLDEASRQLAEYFTGRRTGFDLPLDLRLAKGFRRSVLAQLREISYGRTRTYTQVAAAAGNPKAVRAAGSACATNPLPVVVPCHRVVRSDGSLGGYAGGLAAKRALLDLEAAA
jgi:methylated-DNA-[protein]-cysteine S-methyltransferase